MSHTPPSRWSTAVLVLRALAPQAEAVRKLFIAAWQRLRPAVIGREAVLPRIWDT